MDYRRLAIAALSFTLLATAAGCEQVKEFSYDSIQNLGSQAADTVEAIGDTLGLTSDGPEPEPVHTDRVYELAGPKPTMTEEEKAAEQKKREEILKGVDEYFGSRPSPVPVPDGRDDAAAEPGREEGAGDEAGQEAADAGKAGRREKKGEDAVSTAPEPTEAAEPTAEPAATPTAAPTPSPTPSPVPAATPTPVPDDALLDW